MCHLLWMQRLSALLAAAGLLLPAPPVQADQFSLPMQTVDRAIADIKLTAHGDLIGRVVDHNGTAKAEQVVLIRQGALEVARVTTDRSGTFRVPRQRGGTYQLVSGTTSGHYRVWPASSAPPKAGEQALLVLGEQGTRGQFGMIGDGTVLLFAAATAALVVSLVALKQASDAEDGADNPPLSN